MEQEVYHIPALLPESLEALDINPGGIYIDATLGGGGHSRAIVERLGAEGHLYSLDQDMDAISRTFTDQRFTAVHGNLPYLENYCDYLGISGRIDGIPARPRGVPPRDPRPPPTAVSEKGRGLSCWRSGSKRQWGDCLACQSLWDCSVGKPGFVSLSSFSFGRSAV